MRKVPNIGTQVSFPGNAAIGACSGSVVKQYPGYSGRNEDGQFDVPDRVVVEVAELPARWPYQGTNRFCADVADLKKA